MLYSLYFINKYLILTERGIIDLIPASLTRQCTLTEDAFVYLQQNN